MALLGGLKGVHGGIYRGGVGGAWGGYKGNERVRRLTPAQIFPTFRKPLRLEVAMQIRNRIKELRQVKASELLPNPRNWRRLNDSQ